jgi:hypothetical protein
MSEKMAVGQAVLDWNAVRVGLDRSTNSDPPGSPFRSVNLGEADHQSIAQFVLYDGNGCPNYNYVDGMVKAANVIPPGIGSWVAVTDGQNPDGNVPQMGTGYTVGNCAPAGSCFGIMLDVGRSTSTSVGSAFGQYLNYAPGGQASSPMTLFAGNVLTGDPSGQSSNLPGTLNLAMFMNLSFTLIDQDDALHYYVCPNLVLAQGSNPSTPSQWLSFLETIAQTEYARFQIFSAPPPKAQLQYVNGVVGIYDDIMALIDQNWWIIGVSAQTENYYIPPVLEAQNLNYWYAATILTQCSHSFAGYGVDAVAVPVLISQDTAIVNQTLAQSIFTLTLASPVSSDPSQVQPLNFFPPTGGCSEN